MEHKQPTLSLIHPDICGYIDGYFDDVMTYECPNYECPKEKSLEENDLYDNMEKGNLKFHSNKMPFVDRNANRINNEKSNKQKSNTPYPMNKTKPKFISPDENAREDNANEFIEDNLQDGLFVKGCFRQTNKEPFVLSEKYQKMYDDLYRGLEEKENAIMNIDETV